MKRFVSKIFVLLFISVMVLVPFQSSLVKAAEDSEAATNQTVYYQAIVEHNVIGFDYVAITAVSQYHYKNEREIGKTEDDKPVSGLEIKTTQNFTPINNTSICSGEFGNTAFICSAEKGLNGSLATLTISSYGDVEITLGNEVTLTSLRFYYIIANKSNYTQLYCDNNAICEHAKKITSSQDVTTNWRNNTNSGSMWYGSISINENFHKIESSSGITIYNQYNIIEKMEGSYSNLAKTYGAYVVSAFSISHGGKEYFVNYDLIDGDTTEFTSVGNNSSSAVKNAMVCMSSTIRTGACKTSITMLSNAAVLLASATGAGADSNAGYNQVAKFFEDTGIPILKLIVIVMFLVTGTSTMINIVKASDEPEVRSSEIKRFIGLFIGALVIYLVLEFYDDFISIVSGWFN